MIKSDETLDITLYAQFGICQSNYELIKVKCDSAPQCIVVTQLQYGTVENGGSFLLFRFIEFSRGSVVPQLRIIRG